MSALAQLKAILALDDKSFRAGVEQAKGSTRSLESTIGGIGRAMGTAFSAGMVINFGKEMFNAASEISDMAANIGITTNSLQAFQYAALGTGNDVEQLRKAFSRLAVIQGSITKDKEMQEHFKRLGISISEVVSPDVDALFVRIGAALNTTTDKQGAFNAVAGILAEKVGPKMMALLQQVGGQGLPVVEAAAKSAGAVIDTELIRKMAEVTDSWEMAMKTVKAQVVTTVDEIIPMWEEVKAAMKMGTLGVWTLPWNIGKRIAKDRALKEMFPGGGGASPEAIAAGKKIEEQKRIETALAEIRKKGAAELSAIRDKTGSDEEKLTWMKKQQADMEKALAKLLTTDILAAELKGYEIQKQKLHIAELQAKVDEAAAKQATEALRHEADVAVMDATELQNRYKARDDQKKKAEEARLDLVANITQLGAERENKLSEKWHRDKAAFGMGLSKQYATGLENIGATSSRMGIGMNTVADMNKQYLAAQVALQEEIATMLREAGVGG